MECDPDSNRRLHECMKIWVMETDHDDVYFDSFTDAIACCEAAPPTAIVRLKMLEIPDEKWARRKPFVNEDDP